jgi:hypothetical protein
MKSAVMAGFRALGSPFTLAAVTSALGLWVLFAATIPQGWRAEELLRFDRYAPLRTWARWGLTEGLAAPWVGALAVLGVGALLAHALQPLRLAGQRRRFDLTSPRPERAPEDLQPKLRPWLGVPVLAETKGARTRWTFRSRSDRSSLPLHVGVGLILLGALAALEPAPRSVTVARAVLQVRDRASGAVGRFDLVQGEERSFFRSPRTVRLVGYVPDRKGLGPALRFESTDPNTRRTEAFWVYEDAPVGFDARHRQDAVGMRILDLRLQPRPGTRFQEGVSALAPWLLLLGMVSLGIGVLGVGRPGGRWTVDFVGPRITVTAEPAEGQTDVFFRYTEDVLRQVAETSTRRPRAAG